MYDAVYRRELDETVARESAHLRVRDVDYFEKAKQSSAAQRTTAPSKSVDKTIRR
jgi:hypothetical protein